MSHRSNSSRGSSAWSWSEAPGRGPGTKTRVRERHLPNTGAVKTILWFTGRNPRKVKGVKVYETTWDAGASEASSDISDLSNWSVFSWPWGGDHQKLVEVYLVESKGAYYDNDDDDDAWGSHSRKPGKKRGVKSRQRGGRPSPSSANSGSSSESASLHESDDEGSMRDDEGSMRDDEGSIRDGGGSIRDYYGGHTARPLSQAGMPHPLGRQGLHGSHPPRYPPQPPMQQGFTPRPDSAFRPPATMHMPMPMPPPPGAGRPVAPGRPGFRA